MLSLKNYYYWNYVSTDKLIKIINDIPAEPIDLGRITVLRAFYYIFIPQTRNYCVIIIIPAIMTYIYKFITSTYIIIVL